MDPAFIVPIFHSYSLDRTVSKTVDDTYNTLGKALLYMDLYRESLYTAVMKCNPSAKWLTESA